MTGRAAEPPRPAIEVSNLTMTYQHRPVLRGVTCRLPAGALTGVVGPNGAGKSTLFKAVLSLVPSESGEIRVLGRPAAQVRGAIAYIPQAGTIDWDFPVVVRDVVLMGRYVELGWFKRPQAEDRALVTKTLEEVGMGSLADRHIRHLSGGQQQRVFIARALAQRAEILLMDEPFVGVDATTQEVILGIIARLTAEGRTVVMINHDLSIVRRLDHLVLLNQRVVAEGPPAKIYTPLNLKRTYGGRLPLTDRAEALLEPG